MATVIYYLFLLYITYIVVYSIYKAIWYCIKMFSLHLFISLLKKKNICVKKYRSITDVMFKEKGGLWVEIDSDNMKYRICLLSFVSSHSRWNIEKNPRSYYVEVRKYNKLFYNLYNHSGIESEQVKEFKRETKLKRCEMKFPEPITADQNSQNILLIYPKPKLVTYTYDTFEYVDQGKIINSFKVMYLEDLKAELGL